MPDAQTPVPGMCRGQIGCAVIVPGWGWDGAGKRCKRLSHKPIESPKRAFQSQIGITVALNQKPFGRFARCSEAPGPVRPTGCAHFNYAGSIMPSRECAGCERDPHRDRPAVPAADGALDSSSLWRAVLARLADRGCCCAARRCARRRRAGAAPRDRRSGVAPWSGNRRAAQPERLQAADLRGAGAPGHPGHCRSIRRVRRRPAPALTGRGACRPA